MAPARAYTAPSAIHFSDGQASFAESVAGVPREDGLVRHARDVESDGVKDTLDDVHVSRSAEPHRGQRADGERRDRSSAPTTSRARMVTADEAHESRRRRRW